MSDGAQQPSEKQPGKLFVPSLVINAYSEQSLNLLLSLFLLDIALTFQVSVGAASQIVMLSSVASILVGLLMGALSVKFSHKMLVLAGASIILIGLIGCFIAPNFFFMQIFYPLDGAGSVIVLAMGSALIGRFLPLEKRAKAMGWFVASGTLAWVIGAPLAGFIAGAAGWRYVLLWFFLPISIVGLALAYFNIPSTPKETRGPIGKEVYLGIFKQVLNNKSAAACLVVTTLFCISGIWLVYAMTFYRTRFSIPLESTSLILVALSLIAAVGSIAGGRLVNKYGRQRLAILCCGLSAILKLFFVFLPYVWIVLPLDLTAALLGGIGLVAAYNLVLEQIPQARGTMMSLTWVSGSLGAIIGIIIGGAILDGFTTLTSSGPVLDPNGFLVLVPVFAIFGLASITVNYLFMKDPCKKKSTDA
jgi:predicted MFS family arabinose efflux permease